MTNLNDMSCVHHYIVDEQNNAKCKLCGNTRVFERNPIRYNGTHGLFPIDLGNASSKQEFGFVSAFEETEN